MRAGLVPTLLTLALVGGSCGGGSEPFAAAYTMERLEDGVGGPKAMARPGDLILENDRFRVAILGARNSLGPGLYGGSILDADIRRDDPAHAYGHGQDALAEVFPTVNMNVTRTDTPESVRVLADGSDGGAAIVRVSGPASPFLSLLDALWALVKQPPAWLTTDYIAEPGVPWLTIRTTAVFQGTAEAEPGDPTDYYDDGMPLIDLAMVSGAVFGEFYLQGGSVDVFAPGLGFDEDTAVAERMGSGLNTFLDPFKFSFLAGTADGVSYGIAPKDGQIYVPLFTASQTVATGGGRTGDGTDDRFPAGTSLTYERYFFIGHGDVGSVVDQYLQARDIDRGTVAGHVIEEGTGQALSGVDVFVYAPGQDFPYSQWRTDIAPYDDTADGSFGGSLPVGDWDLVVHQAGRGTGKKVRVTVQEGKDVAVQLAAAAPGSLQFTVRDERGRTVPAKVTIFRQDGPPYHDPVLGDGLIGGSPEAVVFSPYGTGEVMLPPGKYRAVASRGIEYEIDESDTFRIDERTGADIELQVIRSVDTPGWVSADFHVHSIPSHDSGVRLPDRVATMVAEGVEFFAATDHDHVTDFAPTIEAMGLEEFVQSAVGNEVTTVEIGHFLAFPLQHDFLGDMGASAERIDWTDRAPLQLIENMRTLGRDGGFEPMVFVGHPRDGILGYFDQFGFDPYVGTPGQGGLAGTPIVNTPLLSVINPLLAASNLSWDFDALELFNGKRFDYLRTPTQVEMDDFAAGQGEGVYGWISRTFEEQVGLVDGTVTLGPQEGVIDDWFTLLNLGFKFTALANSDTHGKTSVEAGCPRNFVMSSTDDPMLVDDQEIADAVKQHRVVLSYGPFIEFTANGQPIGSELVEAGPVTLDVRISAPTWIPVDRVELYENGTMIHEWLIGNPNDEIVRFEEAIEVTPAVDSWYVVIAMGDGDMLPVFTPVELPPIELQTVVTEALVGVPAVANLIEPAIPIPQVFSIRPYAMTNPIWIDKAGDGFDAPGIPAWFQRPVSE